ncbi:predicted protein [Sclerotinia sclerotiorum 1980 UF-70]|nr:predicted protein [Sclerotinia sclerotiorum 1980 UF-70]EDO00521.1 predicted protein [Sclerotinia sclerotiorum 1980 UF-70]
MIPHYHQFRKPFLPPGIVIPWGPNNTIPIKLNEFRATDPWLPSPFNDPLGYGLLNGVQKRWCQLELYYKQTIFWIYTNFTASNHLENNPRDIVYCFNNICGYFGCQAKDCKHPQLSEQGAFAQQAIAKITTRHHAAPQRAAQKVLKERPTELQFLVQEDSNYVPPTGLNSAVQALEQAFHERQAREQEALETYTGTVEKGVKHYAAQVKQGVAQEAQKITAFQKANAQEAGPSIENTDRCSMMHLFAPEEILLDPKKSRWNTMFPPEKEGTTSEERTFVAPAPYCDGSNAQTSVSDGSGKATTSTSDTSPEGSPKTPQIVIVSKQEANDHSVIYTPIDEEEEDDLCSASPRRVPNSAFATRINSFSPPASKELLGVSIAAVEKDASEMYDDEGFLVEDVAKNLKGLVIEESTGNPDDRSSDVEESDEESRDEKARDEMPNDEDYQDEETQVLPQAGTAQLFQRITIPSTPAISGLAGAFKRQQEEARGIFHRGDTRELHLSDIFRKMDDAKNHIANEWMNNRAQQDPNAPNADFVRLPKGYGCEDENVKFPRAVVEEMNEAEQKIWTMGMRYAEHERLDEMDDPANFTSEMHKV